MSTLGRNDLCWCGSNKKYKKCHMLEDQNQQFLSQNSSGRVMVKWQKSEEEIELMRAAGSFNGQLMDYIREHVVSGVSTGKIDTLIQEYTYDHGFIPACINYRGYPKACCISINEVVCHGIPSEDIIIKDGDIVNVDITTIVDGFHGDQSETFLIGDVSKQAGDLVREAANSMIEGISIVKPGVSFSEIGNVIENYAVARGYSIVVDFTGHGIGRKFHEDPPIYHFKNSETKPFLMAQGMTFTIEPMINAGTWRVDVDKLDGWTVKTKDRKLSAQFEHTILVTETGFEVLTLTPLQKTERKICLLASSERNHI